MELYAYLLEVMSPNDHWHLQKKYAIKNRVLKNSQKWGTVKINRRKM